MPDAYAEKYYHLSPYNYGAGNPIINEDSLQTFFRGQKAKDKFETIVNAGLENQFRVAYKTGNDGNTFITAKEVMRVNQINKK